MISEAHKSTANAVLLTQNHKPYQTAHFNVLFAVLDGKSTLPFITITQLRNEIDTDRSESADFIT